MEGAWLLGPDFGGKAMSEVKYTEEEIEKTLNRFKHAGIDYLFLETFFQILYPSLTEIEFSKLDLILENLYTKFNITKETDISKLKNTDFPILEDLYFFIDNENKKHQVTVYEKLIALIRQKCIRQ